MVIATNDEYNQLKCFIKSKLNHNYKHFIDDIFQDLVIEKDNLKDCFSNYKEIFNRYSVPNIEVDTTLLICENTCTKCNTVQPVGAFSVFKLRNTKYLSNICNECQYLRKRKYYLANKEIWYKSHKKWCENNRDKKNEYNRRYREKKKLLNEKSNKINA